MATLSFQLIDAAVNTVITAVEDGDVLLADTLPDLADLTLGGIVPNGSPLFGQVESAFIDLNDGEATRGENVEPYTLYGDFNGDFFIGDGFSIGESTVVFELFSDAGLQGDLLDTVVLNFSIAEELTSLIVDTLTDEADGSVTDGDVSLRDAIAAIDEGGTITFDPALANGTIDLTLGVLAIDKSLTIDAEDNKITVDANQQSTVIEINDGDETLDRTVTIDGLRITGGGDTNATSTSFDDAGGIDNHENLTLIDSTISGNSASFNSGISNNGVMTIVGSTISENYTEYRAAISNNSGSILTIENSTISSNSSLYDTYPKGIFNTGSLFVSNSTIVENKIDNGIAGLFNPQSGPVSLNITNSIIDGVRGDGTIVANGINLVKDGSVIGALTLDPMLGPLQNNGGLTDTHALSVGSPAIDLGDDSLIPSDTADLDNDGNTFEPVPFDQRGNGFDRIANSAVDLGAYEFQDTASASVSKPGLSPTLTVDTLVDENDFDLSPGDVSLREAIAFVENGGTINFDPSLAGGTINLLSALKIDRSLTINGLGADALTLDAGGNDRVFSIDDGDDDTTQLVALHGLTMTNGSVFFGFYYGDNGGGILNKENLTVTGSNITSNAAGFTGGGVFNDEGAILTVSNSSISNNGGYNGGGIDNDGVLSVSSSTISGNYEGGIDNAGVLTVSNSTISDNISLSEGGGIDNSGELTISNSTISGNSSAYGGGIASGGTLLIANSTIAMNDEDDISLRSGTATFESTIVEDINDNASFGAGFDGTLNVSNSLIVSGDELINGINEDNIIGEDPLLDPAGLQDNGGPTQTISLLDKSPAVNAGSNPDNLDFDQRRDPFSRVANGQADIGAFELQTILSTDDIDVGLYDTVTDELLTLLNDGDVISTNTLPDLDILTIAATIPDDSIFFDDVGSMFLDLNDGDSTRTENVEPYALFGDFNGDFFTGVGIPEGDNEITFDLFSESKLNGDLLDTISIEFSIVDDISPPTSLVVNTLEDELDGSVIDGDVSLRDAIAAIDEGGTITFDSSLANGTIDLALGELAIAKNVTIDGDLNDDRRPDITIDAKQQSRVFNIDDESSVTDRNVVLNGLKIVNGFNDVDPGDGGGIINGEILTLSDSIVQNSSATSGGGVFNRRNGIATIANSLLLENVTSSDGGGFFSEGEIYITDTLIGDNVAGTSEIDGGGRWTLYIRRG